MTSCFKYRIYYNRAGEKIQEGNTDNRKNREICCMQCYGCITQREKGLWSETSFGHCELSACTESEMKYIHLRLQAFHKSPKRFISGKRYFESLSMILNPWSFSPGASFTGCARRKRDSPTANQKRVIPDGMTRFWYAGRDSNPRPIDS